MLTTDLYSAIKSEDSEALKSYTAEVNDVIITVNRTSTVIFPNFLDPGPKIPEITLKIPQLKCSYRKASLYAVTFPTFTV